MVLQSARYRKKQETEVNRVLLPVPMVCYEDKIGYNVFFFLLGRLLASTSGDFFVTCLSRIKEGHLVGISGIFNKNSETFFSANY